AGATDAKRATSWRRARAGQRWVGWRASARSGIPGSRLSRIISPADPPGAEAALGAGDDPVELVEQVARLRDRVGAMRDIATKSAVDGWVVAQRVQRLHAGAVDTVEVPARLAIPVGHRRADVPLRESRHAAHRWELRGPQPHLTPRRERLVDPGVSRLVVPDERVEPLMRRLVIDDQPRIPARADERDHWILDPATVEVGRD